jgi:drug/metabolite transporter (DMT)-like permease
VFFNNPVAKCVRLETEIMFNAETLAVVCGLSSAIVWGAGDFAGGFAARRANALTVILFSQLIGGSLLLVIAAFFAQGVPPTRHLAFAGLAGIFGVLGLIGLYKGLAGGRMGLVAPLSAVVTALVPLIFSTVTEGYPGHLCMAGFLIAMAAVWLLSSPGGKFSVSGQELKLSLFAGLGFGLFFIFMGNASDEMVLWPLVAARGSAIFLMVFLLISTRQPFVPPRNHFGIIALAGILDTLGNAAFGMAAHFGRLDVAAILASLYPASTVILAWLIMKERLGRRQWFGVSVAVVALVLISI